MTHVQAQALFMWLRYFVADAVAIDLVVYVYARSLEVN